MISYSLIDFKIFSYILVYNKRQIQNINVNNLVPNLSKSICKVRSSASTLNISRCLL